jgi:hypothetical protein
MSGPTRPWSSCSAGGSWSRSIPGNGRVIGSPILQDLPEHKAGYALRDLEGLVAAAGKHAPRGGDLRPAAAG